MADNGTPSRGGTLEDRAAAGTLTVHDRELLERARTLRTLIGEGLSITAASKHMCMPVQTLTKFARNPIYAECLRVIDNRDISLELANPEDALKQASARFVSLTPEAVDYVARCFDKWPIGTPTLKKPDGTIEVREGHYVDEGKAMWATERILKGAGLTEPKPPEGGAAPVFTLEAVKALLGAVRRDDAARFVAPQREVIDITPTTSVQ